MLVVPTEPSGKDRSEMVGSPTSGYHPTDANCGGGQPNQSADLTLRNHNHADPAFLSL